MWLSFLNWVDAQSAVIEADVEASDDLVGSNLALRQFYKVWRTDGLVDGATDAGFTIDFGAPREIGALALFFPRANDPSIYDAAPELASTDTIRHRLDLVTPGAGALYDSGVAASGVDSGYGVHAIRLTTPVTARYWRCDIDAISRVPQGYLDVCRAWAGPVVAPQVGLSYGASRGWASDSVIAKAARGGAQFVEPGEPLRSWSFTMDWLDTESETDDFEDFERRMTTAGQFLVCRPDIGVARGCMTAMQAQSSGLDALNFQRDRKSFRLIEAI